MATKPIPTEEQVIGFMDSLSNWGALGSRRRAGDTEPDYAREAG